MAQVIFRVEKIKTVGDIASSLSHMRRDRITLNADPMGEIVVLIAPPPADQIMNVIREKLGGNAPRRNAVLASDILISASPEYFRPNKPGQAGYWQQEKLQAWRDSVEPWIRARFPHAIGVALHLDEATPHYSVIDIPLNERTGQLSHRAKYGGDSRQDIKRWQDLAVEPVAHLGIKRGLPGSTARHVDIAKIYRAVNTPTPLLPAVKTPKPADPGPKPGVFDRAAMAAWKRNCQKVAEQKIKHAEEIRVRNAKAAEILPQVAAKASFMELAMRQTEAYKQTAEKLADENAKLKAQVDELRGIPLTAVLTKLYGFKEIGATKPTVSTNLFGSIKIIGEAWFDDTAGKGGYGAIELVMFLSGVDFNGAAATLRHSFGGPAAVRAAVAGAAAKARAQVNAVPEIPPPLPAAVPEKWPAVREWLTKVCAIPGQMIGQLAKGGRLFANQFAAIVFPLDRGGFAICGSGESKFKSYFGNAHTCGGITLEGPGDVWIVEELLDALARKAIDSRSHVFCTLGATGVSIDQVPQEIPKGRQIVIAFADAVAVQQRTAALAQVLDAAGFECRREASVKKDWTTDLQQGFAVADPRWLEGSNSGDPLSAIALSTGNSDEVREGRAIARSRNAII